MWNIEIVISLLYILLIIGLFFYFFIKNRKIKINSELKLKVIVRLLTINRDQIIKRQYELSKYNFLKYNLNEALVRQPEINL